MGCELQAGVLAEDETGKGEQAAIRKTPLMLSSSEGFPMGKTLPPFSQPIEAERHRWAPFRRALPKEDRAVFDRLFDCAKLHIQAGVMISRPWLFETIVMAVLLEHQKRVAEMVMQVEEVHIRRGNNLQ